MKTERKEIQKIEYVTTYIANDGTEFKSEEECIKYETTARCAIDGMFKSLPMQITNYFGDCDPFCDINSDSTLYAVKIENVDQLEIVNRWIKESDIYDQNYFLGEGYIGSIALISTNWEGATWVLGSVESLKKSCCDEIDKWVD